MSVNIQTNTKHFQASSKALAIALTIGTLTISACSSSGSDSSDSQVQPVENNEANSEQVNDDANTSVLSDSVSNLTSTDGTTQTPQNSVANIDNTETENAITDSSDSNENIPTSEPADLNPGDELVEPDSDVVSTPETNETAPDPFVQNTTTLNFDITVPAYQSNALQVRISWGDISMNAQWIADESWSAQTELPTSTTDTLLVLFNDNNGDITLGSVETSLTTGTDPMQSFTVSADQFDLTLWDQDADGVSNFSESLSGSDPLVDEHSSLEILEELVWPESGSVGLISWLGNGFEEAIPADRPFYEHHEEIVPRPYSDWTTVTNTDRLTIDIDEDGTGTYENFDRDEETPSDATIVKHSATRTNTGQAITWVGEYSRYVTGVAVLREYDFDTVTSKNDDQSYTQAGEVYYYDNCCSHDRRTATYSVTGSAIDDTGYCSLTTGTITFTANLASSNETTLFKATGDRYWRASEFDRNDQLVRRYFVDLIDTSFYCDYQELK